MRTNELDNRLRDNAECGLGLRQHAVMLEKEAKERREQGNEMLEPILNSLQDGKVDMDGVGMAALIGESYRESVNVDRFKLELVSMGVTADIVEAAAAAATEMRLVKGSIRFTPAKGA